MAKVLLLNKQMNWMCSRCVCVCVFSVIPVSCKAVFIFFEGSPTSRNCSHATGTIHTTTYSHKRRAQQTCNIFISNKVLFYPFVRIGCIVVMIHIEGTGEKRVPVFCCSTAAVVVLLLLLSVCMVKMSIQHRSLKHTGNCWWFNGFGIGVMRRENKNV